MGRTNPRTLSDKQERFVHEYMVDLNATQAAIRAGYSARTANRTGARLLSDAYIASRIRDIHQKRMARVDLKADKVIGDLIGVAGSDIRDFLELEDPVKRTYRYREFTTLPSMMTGSVQSVKLSADGTIESIKMHPKIPAVKLLMDHLGIAGRLPRGEERVPGGGEQPTPIEQRELTPREIAQAVLFAIDSAVREQRRRNAERELEGKVVEG